MSEMVNVTTNPTSSPIQTLIDKAEQSGKSEDALRFSQAACNVSHALEKLRESRDKQDVQS